MPVHDPIPGYKKHEKFLHDWNYGHGCGINSPPKTVGLLTEPAAPASEAVGGQFADTEMRPIEEATASTASMPALVDMEPLEGAEAPDPGTYNPTGNKYSRSHSPKTKDDDSEPENSPASQETGCSSQAQVEPQIKPMDDKLPTPDIRPGTPNDLIEQLDKEDQKEEQVPPPAQIASSKPEAVPPKDETVDPLAVLLSSVPTEIGPITVTEEEDWLLGEGDVVTSKQAVRPPPIETKPLLEESTLEQKDDVKLTSADVGDTMEEI